MAARRGGPGRPSGGSWRRKQVAAERRRGRAAGKVGWWWPSVGTGGLVDGGGVLRWQGRVGSGGSSWSSHRLAQLAGRSLGAGEGVTAPGHEVENPARDAAHMTSAASFLMKSLLLFHLTLQLVLSVLLLLVSLLLLSS